jgi:hypothetical protein
MATWTDLKAYIHNTYKVADEREDLIKLIFEEEGLRSQLVLVRYVQHAGTNIEWIQIESPFGELGKVDLTAVLQAVGNTLVGGIALFDGRYVTEFEMPLHLVTVTADQLEKQFTGGDQF